MPDTDGDIPTPEFDDLIEQARELREAGQNDEAIEKYKEAVHADYTRPELCELMELYTKTKKFSSCIDLAPTLIAGTLIRYQQFSDLRSLAEAADTYRKIFILLLSPSEIIDNPGSALSYLAICASILDQSDTEHLYDISKTVENAQKLASGLYGWSDFHTNCYLEYYSASDEDRGERLSVIRDMAHQNPAAWFYVAQLMVRDLGEKWDFDDVIEAYEQVPKGDPNFARAMMQAAYFRECWADDEEGNDEYKAFVTNMREGAEKCYADALEAHPGNKEIRLGYYWRHIERLLDEAAENGFDKARVDSASEFIGKLCRTLSGSAIAVEKRKADEARESGKPPLVRMSEEDQIFIAKIIQADGEKTRFENRKDRERINRLHDELKGLREQLETNIAASAEMIHKYVVERLQAYQEQIVNCERRLSGDHSEFWEQLGPESRRYLATGDYIREKSPVGMECSGEAIGYAKAIETEIRKDLVAPFDAFAQDNHPGAPIFHHEAGQVTLGGFIAVFERSEIRSDFIEHLGEKGEFLSKEFYLLKEIKRLRDAAAHGGDIGRTQATKLRDRVLEILPKIVALNQ